MENSLELSKREMQVLMLCLRGEQESVEGEAGELHNRLVNEGFSAFEESLPAKLTPRDL